MIINIYINWEERKIYSEQEYIDAVIEEVEENLNEWGETQLEEHYSTWELFNLQESEKLNIEEQMKDELVSDTFNGHIGHEWDVVRIKI